MKVQWQKITTRERCLLHVSYITRALLKFKELVGYDLEDILIVSKKGVITVYYDHHKYDGFLDRLKYLFEQGKEGEYIKRAYELDREVVGLMEGNNFIELDKIFAEYWAYYLIVFYLGMCLEDNFVNKYSKELSVLRGDESGVVRACDFFKENNLSEEIEEGYYIWLLRDGEDKYYTGEEAKMIEKELNHIKNLNLKEVKGMSAGKGRVKGVVKVLLSCADIDRIEEGDILVAPMTDPRYLGVMKKAGAFVTDEGGITCHAAIIAREMGKPCVIGVKIATEVFEDGDIVEVDADQGIIRKI